MRFSSAALLMFAITVFSALSLVFASNAKYAFYEDLQIKQESLISKAKQSNPLEIDEAELSVRKLPENGWVKVRIESGYYKEFRYYLEKKIIAIDNLDEGGKPVRRDIIYKGDIRIQLFYDTKGNLIKRNWIDQNGKIVDTKTIFIPLTNIRTGY
jgi:coenzyme F420-reducing hydrogenase alpha subunit